MLILSLLLLMPLFLDSLRVTLGVRFMSLFMVGICFAIWLVKGVAARDLAIRYSPAYFWLAALVAIAFLSITSPVGNPIVKLYRAASFSATRLLMVFLLINFIRSLEQVRRAMYLVIGLASISSLIALWQFWMYLETGTNYSFAEEEQAFRITTAGTFLRATALGADPNAIGSAVAVAAVWCLFLGFATEGMRLWARVVHGLLFLVLTAGVIVTFSRSAIVSLLAVLVLFCAVSALMTRGASRARVAWVWGIVGMGGVGGLWAFPAISGEASGDVLWRIELIQLGLQAIVENPVTGVGVDAFMDYDNPHELAVHNLFVQMGAEMGVLGLLVFAGLTGFLLVRLVRSAWRASDPMARAVVVAVALGYVAKVVADMSNPVLTDLFFWFCVGLGEATVMVAPLDAAERRARASRPE